MAGCFPSPVCGPQNIPFTFYFFRNCHGPDGCDGSCIGASKDLTITLVGRTFDSASLTASPQSSCAGAPVTLTARGYFGVPPYNFVWQGLPQFNGDSVIKVNPDTTTVYTVQVNDACPGRWRSNNKINKCECALQTTCAGIHIKQSRVYRGSTYIIRTGHTGYNIFNRKSGRRFGRWPVRQYSCF